jgi:rare lipoprotein A
MLHLVALLLVSQQPFHHVAQGVASYYTVQSSSRVTASGDLLNDKLYTCAMRDGEFGSYYLVVANNGSAVVCRLNDRGPSIKGRVIDLSEAAMRRLHASEDLIHVKVYEIGLSGLQGLFAAS